MIDVNVRANLYFAHDSSVRILVSICNGLVPIQTVGSWEIDDPVVPQVLKACHYTVNAVKGEYDGAKG